MANPGPILVVDYGMGNFVSVANMLRRARVTAKIASTSQDVLDADKIILPGVGAFDKGMEKLHQLGLVDPLTKRALDDRIPVLGICLGMQLLTHSSDEGSAPGLGWIDAKTTRLRGEDSTLGTPLAVPHMGWNTIQPKREHRLLEDLGVEPRFYFVHSYAVYCTEPSDGLATTTYGETFTSVIAHENILGTQFHPEKSHKFGLALLRNFAFGV